METMLIRETYKMIRVLDTKEDYAFLECVNIRDREKRACLLNLYEGDLLPVYLDLYDRAGNWPAFKEVFLAGNTLVSVVDPVKGEPIDQVFYRGADLPWQNRLELAEQLLHKALTLSELPAQMACAAMLSENLLVDLTEQQIHIRWHLVPMEEMNSRELVYLTVDQLQKILLERLNIPQAERDFMDLLKSGTCTSVVQLYSLWREWQGVILAGYQELEKQSIVRRWLGNLWRMIKYKWKKR